MRLGSNAGPFCVVAVVMTGRPNSFVAKTAAELYLPVRELRSAQRKKMLDCEQEEPGCAQ